MPILNLTQLEQHTPLAAKIQKDLEVYCAKQLARCGHPIDLRNPSVDAAMTNFIRGQIDVAHKLLKELTTGPSEASGPVVPGDESPQSVDLS